MDPLPDYKQMTPEVRDRFVRLKRRPVIMEGIRVCKEFPASDGPRTVLKDVSFRLRHREFLSIIGPSGCGKYTLFPWLTVCRNVMFGLETAGYSRDGAENMALQWLDIIGLEKYADYYPGQLSGGMQQRVAIARALAPQPRVLLMDEPFGALDAQTRAQMQNYLLEVWHNIDITVIFVTHDLDEAVYLSDRILALKANPGEVNEVIEVPVPRPRAPDMLLSPEFQATRRHIDELINPNRRAQKPDFKIINMVGTRNYL